MTITDAVRVSVTQAAGTYTGTIGYTVIPSTAEPLVLTVGRRRQARRHGGPSRPPGRVLAIRLAGVLAGPVGAATAPPSNAQNAGHSG